MGLKRTSASGEEPVTTERVRAWARMTSDDNEEDVLLLLNSSREYVERLACRAVIRSTYEQTLSAFPADGEIRLYRPPLISVSEIAYVDEYGDSQTLATSAYDVDTHSEPGRIWLASGQTWPATLETPAAVTVTFVAGYTSASTVPSELKQLVLMVARERFINHVVPESLQREIEAWRHGAIEVCSECD